MNAPYDSSKQRIELLERQMEALTRKLDQGFDRSMALNEQPRLAKTYNPGSYPSDPANVYPIMFLNGTFTETAGNQTPTYTNRSSTSKRVGFGLTDEYIEAGTVVACWRQNNRWWILPTATTESEGGGSYTLISAGFDVEGTGSTNNQSMDKKAVSDDTAWITWQFDSALLKGGGGGITWDAANYAFNLDVGEWYLWLGSVTDIGDITTGVAADISTKMPTTTNGPPIVAILNRVEEYDPDTTTWESLDDSSWTAVAEVGGYTGMFTTLYRYENANESSRKVRIRSRISGNSTEMAVTARMYHKKWHCWRIGT